MNAKNDYGQLDARFGVVRRAWKRAAALSGLAIVASESIGIFTAMLFLDWLYQPVSAVRIGMWGVALAVIAWFFAKHVIKPLLRKIPNEQIALYIEENRTELDGVLITAAEFGKNRDHLTGRQADIIDTIVHEAADRSTRTPISRVVDFSRLKKYGIGAAAAIGAYFLLSVMFPATFGHHLGRILQPWQTTVEDLARHNAATAAAEALRLTLSKGDTSLPRGTSFDFEATLSKAKPADQAVVLYFRPKAGGDWQKLAMTEIEKINGFQGVLPDVSEDLEFMVKCGEAQSEVHKLTVYDPLVVQSLEVTTHYPDYVKQPDRVEKPSPGDVTALIGSKVTLRVLTSTPLKDGQIKWSNGQTAEVTVDPQSKATATVSFEVKEDATYDYLLTDVNGQQAVSAAPLSVHAIPDTPPTVNVKSPQSPLVTNMVGEVNFQVEAGDDFGVESLELVYSRIDAKGDEKEVRVPLPYKATSAANLPHAIATNYHLALEEFNPPLQPNDALPYHVEAKDAKGQVASSAIGLLIVDNFEHWGTWMEPEGGSEVHNDTNADLMQILALVWEVDNQKTQIKPEEMKQRSTKIAGMIVDGDGNLNDFLNLEEHPQLAKVADLINGHIKKGHDLLVTADTGAALNQLSIAAAIMAGNGIDLDAHVHGNESQEIVVGSHTASPKITMLEQARLTALSNAAKDKLHDESDQTDAAAAAATAQEVADLLKQQDALVAHAQAMANGGANGGAPHDNKDKGQSFGASKAGAGAASAPQPATPSTADLAAQQHEVADKTRAAAAGAQAQAAGGNNTKLQDAAAKTADAARLMEEASRAFAAGKADEGKDKATLAQTALHAVSDTLQNTDRNQLEAAISAAAARASVLLDKQKDLGTQTDALAKELGTNKPDQRQQRDLQKQAYTQTQLGAETETLNSEINDLSARAAQVGQPEAIRALTDAQHDIKRGQPQVKMSNAVIDLNNASPGTAGDEQKNAAGSLEKIVASLQAGSDALAASREAQLTRANRVAQDAKKDLNTLLAKAGLPQPKGDQGAGAQGKGDQAQAGAQGKGDQPQPGAQAGTQPGQQPGAQAGTQPGQQPGAQAGTQPGTQPGQQPGAQAGTQPGTQPGAQAGTQPGQQPGAQASSAGSGGGDDIRKLAYNLTQLTAVIDNRQLVPQDQVEQLKEMSMDKAELEKKLAVDPKFLQDVSGIVASISGKIEAEMEAKTEASKLFSSQREECPPSYRQFVNKYFEALSQVAPAPGQDKAAAPGQP